MSLRTVLISGVVITGVGVVAYIIYLKVKERAALLAEQERQNQIQQANMLKAAKDAFCDPPGTDVFNKAAVQYKMASEEWERRGRGMGLDHFIEQYKKEMGCQQEQKF